MWTKKFLLGSSLLISACDISGNSGLHDFDSGLAAFNNRNCDIALEHLKKAEKKHLTSQNRASLFSTMAVCYDILDDLDSATRYHEKAIALEAKNPSILVNQGVTFRKTNQYDKARENYETALKHSADYVEAYASLGALELVEGNTEEAIEYLEKATDLDGTSAISFANLAVAYAFVGRIDEARVMSSKADALGYWKTEKVNQFIQEQELFLVGVTNSAE